MALVFGTPELSEDDCPQCGDPLLEAALYQLALDGPLHIATATGCLACGYLGTPPTATHPHPGSATPL